MVSTKLCTTGSGRAELRGVGGPLALQEPGWVVFEPYGSYLWGGMRAVSWDPLWEMPLAPCVGSGWGWWGLKGFAKELSFRGLKQQEEEAAPVPAEAGCLFRALISLTWELKRFPSLPWGSPAKPPACRCQVFYF